jgi:hypothetical protein
MARFDEIIDNKATIGDGAVPDFVISFTLSLKGAACVYQKPLECWSE